MPAWHSSESEEERKRREAAEAKRAAKAKRKRERKAKLAEEQRVAAEQKAIHRKQAAEKAIQRRKAKIAELSKRLATTGLAVPERELNSWAPEGLTAGRLFDLAAMRWHPERLIDSLKANFDATGLDLSARRSPSGIVLHRYGTNLVLITASHAAFRFKSQPPIPGPFHREGVHWDKLRSRLIEQKRKSESARLLGAEAQDPVRRLLTELPEDTPAELRQNAAACSERIRNERTLAFGHPVVIEHAGTRVTFSPTVYADASVSVPFVFRPTDDHEVAGALRITSLNNPLPITVEGPVAESDAVRAWLYVLAAFADLTCMVTASESSHTPREQRPSVSGSRGARNGAPRSAPRATTGLIISDRLTPIGLTARHIASYVAGHRRRLRPGQRSSESAREAARREGFELRPQETWVRPHARGLAPDAELRFRWSPPASFARVT
ncbi:MAG: hypothetical protein ACLP22_20400 [Solirubrobacteraceae bacterium]